MKAFCFLIAILLSASVVVAQEQAWFDAEGKVVRVTKKADIAKAPSWLEKENTAPEVYRWSERVNRHSNNASRLRPYFHGHYWNRYGSYRPFFRSYNPNVYFYGNTYRRSYAGCLHYRRGGLSVVIRR